MKIYTIKSKLSLKDVKSILSNKTKLILSDESRDAIQKCRSYLDSALEKSTKPLYGINTGFGSLCNVKINNTDLNKLQENLMMSHACGVGEEVPHELVKIMLLLKVQGLSYGYSAVQVDTVQRLIDFFNNDIIPVVYSQGSLGASGDLAPLAHLCLPLIGKGEVYFNGDKMKAADALKIAELKSVSLQSKEGLALLNGTQFMSAYGVYCILKAQNLNRWADTISAISLDAFGCLISPFNELIQKVRPHKGQIETAKNIRNLLKHSKLITEKKDYVQDPYSFRCIPQVHGASKDALNYVANVFETEINSVTDNPTVFPDEELIISAGNFHGQPLALALDFLGISLAEIANISERRTYQLISGKRGLPSFLVSNPGLNSGFMISQYTAASIVSQNKGLTHPASVDSIGSSQGQEDHVSMGANAATKTYAIINNVKSVLAIELLNAAQAMEFRDIKKTSPELQNIINEYRKKIPFVDNDTTLYPLIHNSIKFIED